MQKNNNLPFRAHIVCLFVPFVLKRTDFISLYIMNSSLLHRHSFAGLDKGPGDRNGNKDGDGGFFFQVCEIRFVYGRKVGYRGEKRGM